MVCASHDSLEHRSAGARIATVPFGGIIGKDPLHFIELFASDIWVVVILDDDHFVVARGPIFVAAIGRSSQCRIDPAPAKYVISDIRLVLDHERNGGDVRRDPVEFMAFSPGKFYAQLDQFCHGPDERAFS
jgi:hypothetical protein